MFMAYGLFTAWQTSIFRVMIAPWYTTMVMSYWLGLAGLAYLLAASRTLKDEVDALYQPKKMLVSMLYPLIVLVVILGLYLKTNFAYHDKSFSLASRSPVSAACLRSYEWAPTYCERSIFQWTVNRVYLADFAWPLQRHQLSVFATHQRWSMQGEMILGSVFSPEAPNTLGVDWYDGLPGMPASFTDYRHLNLRVTPARSVVWSVRLPDHLLAAGFASAIGVGSSDQGSNPQGPLTFEVHLAQPGVLEELVFSQEVDAPGMGWSKFKLDLLPYRGQEIRLRFSVRGGIDLPATLYRYPTIDLTMQPECLLTERPEVRPVNTSLSPRSPKPTSSDYLFDLKTTQPNGLEPIDGSRNTWHVSADPYFYITLDDPIDLRDFGYISIKSAASVDMPARAAEVYLYFEGQDQPAHLVVPLMPDGDKYTYSYPLRMVDIRGNLVAVRLNPVL